MKYRNGFVSNSSSCSFIVPCRQSKVVGSKICNERVISEEKEKKLLAKGFKYAKKGDPALIEATDDLARDSEYDPFWVSKEPTNHLGISLPVNSCDIIELLGRLKVPFRALDHYGHVSLFYDGKSKDYLEVDNTGLSYSMYGRDDWWDILCPKEKQDLVSRRKSLQSV